MLKWVFFDLGSTLLDESACLLQIEKLGCAWPAGMETVYPGAPDLLRKLHTKYKLGIIANQAAGTEQRLRDWGLAQYFDVIAASGELNFAKPDPRIFQLALKRAGCAPEEAIMIGDRLDNDIAPAKRLGMKTIWLRQSLGSKGVPVSAEMMPDRQAKTLEEIPECLR